MSRAASSISAVAMHIDCGWCGAASPSGLAQCARCAQPFTFLLKEDADWEPHDYSMWMHSRHRQICHQALVQGTASLSAAERLRHLVGQLYFEVRHRGIWQYLASARGAEPRQLLQALRSIGATKLVASLEACLSWFPAGALPADAAERDRLIHGIPEAAARELRDRMFRLVCEPDADEVLLMLLRQATRNLEWSGHPRMLVH
jgi:hypothetical protein